MNCQKCGTKVKVIESREKNGDIRRREYCPTCRFESTRLVPNGVRVLRREYNDQSMKVFLSAEDGKEHPIEDIRGSAQVWTENWKKRLLACKNHELDAAGKDLREMWPRASKNYCTRREDHWHDEKYREELLCAITGMAADRIARWEAKSPTVPSPKTAEERQHRDAQRPPGRPGDWWLNPWVGKPAKIEAGQRWLRYNKEPVVITSVHGLVAVYKPVDAMTANGLLNTVRIDVILPPDDGQWKFFGYEPGQEPKKELAKPDAVRVGQKWDYIINSERTLHTRVIDLGETEDGYPAAMLRYTDKSTSLVAIETLHSSKWMFAGEPEPVQSYGVPDGAGGLVKIKPGQKWRCKETRCIYVVKKINRDSDEQIRVTFEENGWDFARVMLNGTYGLVSEPEPKTSLPEIKVGQKWSFKNPYYDNNSKKEFTVRAIDEKIGRVYFVGHDDSFFEHVSIMVETGSPWTLVHEPLIET